MILCIDCYRCELHCMCTWPTLTEVQQSKCDSCRKPRKARRVQRSQHCAPGKHEFTRLYNEGRNCINCGYQPASYSEYTRDDARALGFFDE